jgi:hypothetical protein
MTTVYVPEPGLSVKADLVQLTRAPQRTADQTACQREGVRGHGRRSTAGRYHPLRRRLYGLDRQSVPPNEELFG